MSAVPRIIKSSPRAQNRRRGPIGWCWSINPSRSSLGHLRGLVSIQVRRGAVRGGMESRALCPELSALQAQTRGDDSPGLAGAGCPAWPVRCDGPPGALLRAWATTTPPRSWTPSSRPSPPRRGVEGQGCPSWSLATGLPPAVDVYGRLRHLLAEERDDVEVPAPQRADGTPRAR